MSKEWFSAARLRACGTLLALLAAAPLAGQGKQVLLRVQGPDTTALVYITELGGHVGFVGDYLRLPLGTYTARVDNDSTLREFTFQITDDGLRVMTERTNSLFAHLPHPGMCADSTLRVRAGVDSAHAHVALIVLDDPQPGKACGTLLPHVPVSPTPPVPPVLVPPTSLRGGPPALFAGITPAAMISPPREELKLRLLHHRLVVTSRPQAAGVWVGRSYVAHTQTVLSIPYRLQGGQRIAIEDATIFVRPDDGIGCRITAQDVLRSGRPGYDCVITPVRRQPR